MTSGLLFQNLGVLAGAVALAGLTAWLTARIRRYALERGMEDVPNERSSHTTPTPRGGGASIVAVSLLALVAIAVWTRAWRWPFALAAGGLVVALTGWLDDVRGLRARTRLLAHFAAAGVSLFLIRGELVVPVPPYSFVVGGLALVLAALYMVWSINSYNFMDGIDGIAASECLTVVIVLGPLAEHAGHRSLALLCGVLASACLGFLALNWQPARIFMGDVCSGFLGFLLALMGLWGQASGAVPLTATLILTGVFVVDATYTLFRRLLAGERVYQAHRDHAYQHATQRGWSHARVTGAVIAINLLWLAPLAVLATARPRMGWPLLGVAYLPLLAAAIWLRAGRRPAGAP